MKVLVVHNAYQQRGGEDAAVHAEIKQLAAHGDTVFCYERHNDELRDLGILDSLKSALQTLWGSASYRALKQIIAESKPDIAHFHNTFPLISPSAYYACAEADLPVVQTLHNYRLLCPAATLMRKGRVCETCLGRTVPLSGVLHACYRKSFPQSAVLAAMLAAHKVLRTWANKVAAYIALSEFARQKFVQGGLPEHRIFVKPNFVHPDPGPKKGPGGYALFVGRLSPEKGLHLLLDAWHGLSQRIPLFIIGDGPLREEILGFQQRAGLAQVTLLGSIPAAEVLHWMRGARFLVCPSLWFEGFPLAVAEAFASALPVIASRIGSLAEIVQHARTGLLFTPGKAEDLADRVKWAWDHPEQMEQMGRLARFEYERKYTAERNYRSLMRIYDEVLEGNTGMAGPKRTAVCQVAS
jgi:glycosyltransferase involved in cell wall biosynthesis